MAREQRRRRLPQRASLDVHADAPDAAAIIGIEIEDDRAAAQRRALADAVARVGERQIIGGRDRERQYVAIVQRGAHDALASASDRKGDGWGKGGSVRVDLGGRRSLKKK